MCLLPIISLDKNWLNDERNTSLRHNSVQKCANKICMYPCVIIQTDLGLVHNQLQRNFVLIPWQSSRRTWLMLSFLTIRVTSRECSDISFHQPLGCISKHVCRLATKRPSIFCFRILSLCIVNQPWHVVKTVSLFWWPLLWRGLSLKFHHHACELIGLYLDLIGLRRKVWLFALYHAQTWYQIFYEDIKYHLRATVGVSQQYQLFCWWQPQAHFDVLCWA